ncbi:MAG: PepSY domain-containing protein [Rhizobiales bacterium]|nr:PepSY domain-containing protein [Hyphomicrobiales bacterium]
MSLIRAAGAALALVLAVPAAANGCLSQGEARQAVQVLSAQLCRAGGGLVYVVSVLGEGGQVRRLTVDAVSGAVSGN